MSDSHGTGGWSNAPGTGRKDSPMFRKLRPGKVYVTDDVYGDPRAAACVERLMTAVEGAEAESVSYSELNEIARRRWPDLDSRWGAVRDPRDPDLVMTLAKFWPAKREEEFRERYPHLQARDLYGFRTHRWREDGELHWRRDVGGVFCQSAWEIRSIYGCPFRCAYCGLGGVNRVLVNMEECVEHLDELCAMAPAQRLYKWDNTTDVSCFEPEYGASRLFVEYFANKPGKYLEIYVGKSDNVNNLLSLDHKGKTVLQWSLCPRTQASRFEPETASWERRIEAARECHEAGYITRFRFSPMIPVRNWKEEYAELMERIFERAHPDVITLCPLGWMNVEEAKNCLDFSLLDPQYVQAMEASAPFVAARRFRTGSGRLIPHEARAFLLKTVIDLIRERHKSIPISLCLETVEMWALFQEELGMHVDPGRKSNYYCTCGPQCTPEHHLAKGVAPGRSWFDSGAK